MRALLALSLGLLLLPLGCGDDDDGAPRASGDAAVEGRGDATPGDPDAALPPSPWARGGWVIGYSALGRPIVAEQYGLEGPALLLLSAIHGDERSAVTFGERIRATLLTGIAEGIGARIIFIGAANPDGIALETRENAEGVDVNRDFDAHNAAGATLTSPEARVLTAVLEHTQPAAVVSVHCCVPTMDYDGPGRDLAEVMVEAMDEEARFPRERYGSMPGSLGSLVGLDLEIPVVTVEFARDEVIETELQLESVERAVLAAAAWVAEHGGGAPGGVEALEPRDAPLTTWLEGEGVPVRVEEIEGEGDPLLLLGGLIDEAPQALYVAEHLRRVLLAERAWGAPALLLTRASLDGGGLVDGLIDAREPSLIIHVVGDEEADWVAASGLELPLMPEALAPRDAAPGAEALGGTGAPVVTFGVRGPWGRGDDQGADRFPETDQEIFSAAVYRILHPGSICAADGHCDVACEADPDCACDCDFNADVCEPAARESVTPCACDPDCAGGAEACAGEGHCDSWCPPGVDPDCDAPCDCDYHGGICEAAARGSLTRCACDPDCEGGVEACGADAHCDTWCPDGEDPDC